MKISIIIPTYGNAARCSKLLKSIRQHEAIGNLYSAAEVIVINDNPQAHTLGLPVATFNNLRNMGFAASVNRGLQSATGDILLLVNDDIIWTNPILERIGKEFEADPELGVLGCLLKYPNRAIQHAGMSYDPNSKSFFHIRKNPTTKYMIAVTGALFAISRKLYETIGGLDESFFLACEDTKYCLDAWEAGFKVKFAANIGATHEEGATRGKTPQQKKRFRDWTTKESEGIKRFRSAIDNKQIIRVQKIIRRLNGEATKIEVGSGYNPHPGYQHLDVRAGLPHLEHVCDFTKTRLPFADSSVEEILANHLIEHLPFRKLPFVISEWARVLEDGGKLKLRTPNLKFICETYLAGKTTPEWPDDEKFIKENLSKEVTPAWWANLKLFSGQDYDANFHHVCFDFEMLS